MDCADTAPNVPGRGLYCLPSRPIVVARSRRYKTPDNPDCLRPKFRRGRP